MGRAMQSLPVKWISASIVCYLSISIESFHLSPPYCCLCKKDFRCEYFHTGGGGKLVRFRDYRALPLGVSGKPHGLEWFCNEHLAAAQDLAHNNTEEAMSELRQRFGDFAGAERPSLSREPALWVTAVGPNFPTVYAIVRRARSLGPADAWALVQTGEFLVAAGWPAQFQHWRDALEEAGATVAVRYG